MGRALAGLVTHEPATVVDQDTRNHAVRPPGCVEAAGGATRSSGAGGGGALLAAAEGDELCPCGSGFKYKLCHGVLRNR